jgi:phosphonate transport system substrate-binding protein
VGRNPALILAAATTLAALVAAGDEPPKAEPLRLGVVSLYNPRAMFLKYQPLVDYLSEQTGRRWELGMSRRYADAVEALCSGLTTVAYLDPFTYVRAHATCGAEPLVRLNTAGRATFRSHILVRADSPFAKLSDLSGQRIAFGEPLSTSSHLMPRALLRDADLTVGRGLTCVHFDHYERVARAVLLGEAEACGIRDSVAEEFLPRGLRTLARSDPIPNFPFAVTLHTPAPLKASLRRILLAFPERGPRPLGTAWDRELARGFAPAADADYDPVRRLATRIFGPSALTLGPERLLCAEPAR